MRLTLRTLLAWMDGLLPSAEAQELSVKVESNAAARQLAERIRAAVARGPLPPVESDPNTVAEYLDNRLSTDALVSFERSCLASDAQLAEVAGCHELLAELVRAGGPPERTAAAVPGSPPGGSRYAAPPRPRSSAGDAADEPVIEPVELWEPRKPRVPDRSRRQVAARTTPRTSTATAWLSLLAAVVLLTALGGVLAWSLIRTPRGRRGPADLAVVNVVPEPAVPDPVVIDPGAPPTPVQPRSEPPVPAPAAAPVLAAPSAPQAVIAREVMPQEVGPQEGAADARVPFGDALAIVAPPEGVRPELPPAPRPPDASVAAVVPVAPAPDVAPAGAPLVTVGPAVLRRDDADGGATWEAVTAGHPLALPANLVTPACGRPAITVDGLRLDVSPGTQLTLGRDADDTPRLTVGFGSVVVSTVRADARLGVTAGELSGVATLDPSGRLGIEATIDRQPGDDPEFTTAKRTARVIGLAAPFGWRQTATDGAEADQPLAGIAPEQVIPGRAAVAWSAVDPAAAEVIPAGSPPPWSTGGTDRLDRSAAEAVAARLEAGEPVSGALRDLVAAGRVETRTAAAATLALMGDYAEAVRLLCGDLPGDALREEQWRSLEAAVVPLALARGPRAAAALAEAFAAHAPPGGGVDLFRLARGLSDAELAAGGGADLVAALESPQLAVRRYAFKNLVEITGAQGVDRLRYRPDRPESLRREGVAWWQAQLAQGRIRRMVDAAQPPRP